MNHLLAQFTIDGVNGQPPTTIEGTGTIFDSASIGEIVGKALPLVFAAAGIGLLLMIISSGYTLMMSAGDAKKAAAGKTTLTNSIVGFLLVFAAFWITQALGVVFGWQDTILSIFGQ